MQLKAPATGRYKKSAQMLGTNPLYKFNENNHLRPELSQRFCILNIAGKTK